MSALATMALQASNTPGGGRETVDLAHAARTAAGDQATPVLLSLLAAREAVGHADAFPRNHVAYTVGLASILTQRGQLDEAISLTSDAIHGVQEVQGSGRTIADLRRTVDLLGKQKYPPATTFATAARRLLPASR